MCGVIGVSKIPEAGRLAYLGLYALQHRGQESAGIVAVDREGQAKVDLEAELKLQHFLVTAARERLLRSAHDCSEGGLAVTLAVAPRSTSRRMPARSTLSGSCSARITAAS